MERAVIERGGRVIDDITKSMFVIQEDGFDSQIWSKKTDENASQDSKPNMIHFRFVEQCIQQQAMLNCEDALHLCPLPHSVPIADFKRVCLEFVLIPSQLEDLVFGNLIELYGFRRGFKE